MRRRIHIVGLSPRTGTTLMAECMAACFKIDAVENHEGSLVARREARVYLSKSPNELPLVGPRLRFDPRLYVICMERDPRDVIVSRHGKDSERYWAPLRMWRDNLYWLRSIRQHSRFLLIRYEDLVSEPDAVQEQVKQRLPFLKQRAKFSQFHKVASPSKASKLALRGVREISSDSVGQWREHLPRVAGQIQQHGAIDRQLIDLGYEKDSSWLRLLDGVEPDLTPSHIQEFRAAPFGRDLRWRIQNSYKEAYRGALEYYLRKRTV